MDVNNEGFFEQPKWTIDSLEQEIYKNTREFVSLNVMEWLLNLLNTTPQQRTWVDLTKEERIAIFEKNEPFIHYMFDAIEAKLKEKNT